MSREAWSRITRAAVVRGGLKASGLGLEEVARRARVNVASLRRWCSSSDSARPSAPEAIRLGEVLGWNAREVMQAAQVSALTLN